MKKNIENEREKSRKKAVLFQKIEKRRGKSNKTSIFLS
jgi:hypothetical protein